MLTVAAQDAVDGTPFGRYRLVELLGRGGMGEVWRAHDTVTDRVVAIKVLPAQLSEDEEFQRRFRREAHAAARLGTPHVVPIYDYGEIDGRLFVSMRLIAGRDLDTVLADGPLEPARAVRIIDQVAKALHAAHKVGLIHRDIKPSNILLDDDDFAYLIDFGIVRAADETRMTKSGNTIGTFAYIAPERLDPRTQEDARADIYSLACVLYEALTGEPPFAGTTTAHLMYAHVNTPPPRPSTTQPDVPAQFDAVIAKGMAKEPDQRYATTTELSAAALHALTTMPSRTPYTDPTVLDPTQRAISSTMLDKQPAPPAPPTPVPTSQQPAGSAKRSPIRAATIVPVVMAVLLLGAVAFAVTQFLRPDAQLSTAPPHWQPYVDLAKKLTVDMTSLSYRDPDGGIQRVLDESTGQFHDDFARRSSDFKQVVVQSKEVTQGTVTGAGLESMNGTVAEVLVAATSKITETVGTPQEPRKWRLRIQVEKIGDAYKVSKLDFVS
jgi:serine/threonine protein kinase